MSAHPGYLHSLFVQTILIYNALALVSCFIFKISTLSKSSRKKKFTNFEKHAKEGIFLAQQEAKAVHNVGEAHLLDIYI